MLGELELGSLNLALLILGVLLGSLLLLVAVVTAYYFLANAQNRRLEKTLKHCGLEDYHAKTLQSVREYGYLQRAPYDVSGIDVQDNIDNDVEYLQMMRDLRQVNKGLLEQERLDADYWGSH